MRHLYNVQSRPDERGDVVVFHIRRDERVGAVRQGKFNRLLVAARAENRGYFLTLPFGVEKAFFTAFKPARAI